MARRNVCPRCGTSVGQFAAGCSVCGFDLAQRRPNLGERLSTAVQRSSISYTTRQLFESAFLTLVMVLVALYAPLWGMLLSAFVFFDRRRKGERTMRNMAAAGFTISLIAFFIPVLPFAQLGPVWSGA